MMIEQNGAAERTLEICDLEYVIGPVGSTEAVGGLPCGVAIVWLLIASDNL